MKKKTFSILFAFILLSFSFSCDSLQGISGMPGSMPTSTHTRPTHSEINSGLKEALKIGIQQGIQQVSAKDGCFKNSLIKILFPPEARKVEHTLRQVGLGHLCDNVVLSLNRAAEGAAKEALPIFVSALKNMSFQDASQILLGNDTSATHYFRKATTQELSQKFEPVITKNLNKVDATRYWGTVMEQYNKIPLVKPINTDLSNYVTHKAIDGLFAMIAEKEINIRENITSRTTPLLKKVFGYADQEQ